MAFRRSSSLESLNGREQLNNPHEQRLREMMKDDYERLLFYIDRSQEMWRPLEARLEFSEIAKHFRERLAKYQLGLNDANTRNILAAAAGYARSEQIAKRKNQAARVIQKYALPHLYRPDASDFVTRRHVSNPTVRSEIGDIVKSMQDLRISS